MAFCLSRGTSAPPDPRMLPECAEPSPLPDRENGTNPGARRSIPGFRGNGKCKHRTRTQEITTFPGFACCRRPLFGIIDCNQHSYSRSRNTGYCDFVGGADPSINLPSQTQSGFIKCYTYQVMFNDSWFTCRLEACIEHMPTLQH